MITIEQRGRAALSVLPSLISKAASIGADHELSLLLMAEEWFLLASGNLNEYQDCVNSYSNIIQPFSQSCDRPAEHTLEACFDKGIGFLFMAASVRKPGPKD